MSCPHTLEDKILVIEAIENQCPLCLSIFLVRIRNVMRWMVPTMKTRADDCHQNIEEGSEGGYSDYLLEAMEVLKELEKI